MAITLLSLPPEVKLSIAGFLNFKDHYRLARTCQHNWALFHHDVKTNKLRNEYEHLDLSPTYNDPSGNARHKLDRIVAEPYLRAHTKFLSILGYGDFFTHHNAPSGKQRHIWQARHGPNKDQIIQLCKRYQRTLLKSAISTIYDDDHHSEDPGYDLEEAIVMALIVSFPQLQELAFSLSGIDEILGNLMTHYRESPETFPGLFQFLTHVQLRTQGALNYEIVHQFALLPSMKRIDTVKIYMGRFVPEEYKGVQSNVEELIMYHANFPPERLEDCMDVYGRLQRFGYSARWVHFTRPIIRALLRHTSDSLLSIHLDDHLEQSTRDPQDERERIANENPHLCLKRFRKLQLLHCEWDDVIPKEYSEHQVRVDHEFPLDSGRLSDILPESLVVLQIKPPLDKHGAEEQLIEYLQSKPAKLRRIDWNDPSDSLEGAARLAGIELHPVVGYKGWSCGIGCDCGWHLQKRYGIYMPPDIQ